MDTLNCETVNFLLSQDQFYRIKHMNILSPTFYFLDSLLKKSGYKTGLDELSNVDPDDMKAFREQVEIIENDLVIDQTVVDSIWQLQEMFDHENTIRLISILDKMDKTKIDKMPYECGRESFIVFVHSPSTLKEEVKRIIDKIGLEKIDEAQFNHISWHLNGRN